MAQRIGMWLIGLGALVLAIAALIRGIDGFFLDPEVWLGVRIAVGVGAVGLLVLLGVVIRERMSAARSEDFSEVEW